MKCPNRNSKQQSREQATEYYHNPTRQVNNCRTQAFWSALHHTGQGCDSLDIERHSLVGHEKLLVLRRVILMFSLSH